MEEGKPTSTGRVPYGTAFGLFAASVATLAGIVRDVSPEVILLRAAGAGAACGVTARLVAMMLRNLAGGRES